MVVLDVKNIVDTEIDRVLKVYDEFKKKEIDPLADVGNPEKIIGKPYGRWSDQDKQMLRQAYVYSPQDLEEFISKKEVDALWSIQDINKKLGV